MIRQLTLICLLSLLLLGLILLGSVGYAEADSLGQEGTVRVEGSSVTQLIDPEHPENKVNPGAGPATDGALRIDYISALDFGFARIIKGNRTYEALAQQFHNAVGPRGSYIQITDQRAQSTGWTIQLKQNYQFRNVTISNREEQELRGAVLSFDKGWANTSGYSDKPTVTRETIELSTVDTAYELATASNGQGQGVWTIAFGASEANKYNQEATLKPLLDRSGAIILDKTYRKAAYSNSAVTLTIPDTTLIYQGEYETELTWILGELP